MKNSHSGKACGIRGKSLDGSYFTSLSHILRKVCMPCCARIDSTEAISSVTLPALFAEGGERGARGRGRQV